jgi:hypothetical protein
LYASSATTIDCPVEYARFVSRDSNKITSFILGAGIVCTVVVLYFSEIPEDPDVPFTPEDPDVPFIPEVPDSPELPTIPPLPTSKTLPYPS